MRLTLFPLCLSFLALQVLLSKDSKADKFVQVLKKTVKNNADKKIEKKKEELKWEIQKTLIRGIVLQELEHLLNLTSIPRPDQEDTLQFADNLLNQTFKAYEKLNQTQKDQIQKLLVDVPKEYDKLKTVDKDQLLEDFQYLRKQDQDKQEILLSVVSQNVSEALEGKVPADQIINNVHSILHNDMLHPNQTYSNVPKNWDLTSFIKDEPIGVQQNLEDMFDNESIQEQILDMLDEEDLNLGDLQGYLDDIFSNGEEEDMEEVEDLKDKMTSLFKEWSDQNQEAKHNTTSFQQPETLDETDNSSSSSNSTDSSNSSNSSNSTTSGESLEEEVKKPKQSTEQVFMYFMIICAIMSLLLLVILILYRKLRRLQITVVTPISFYFKGPVGKDGQIQFDKEVQQENYY